MSYKYSKKVKNFHVLKCHSRCSVLRAKGFSCSLCVLFGGLGITKYKIAVFLSKKYTIFSAVSFSIFSHQNPGFETGSGSALNQCGSTTLPLPSKNSPRYCQNFGNFLIRLSFAEASNFLYGVKYQDVLKSTYCKVVPN